MKIVYLANIRFPTEKAHGYQISKMCEAFSDIGVEMEIIVPLRKNSVKVDPYEFYGVRRNFKTTFIKSFDFIKFGKMGFLLNGFLFYLKASRLVKGRKVYSRDLISLFFFKNSIIEIHEWRKKTNLLKKFLLKRASFYIVLTSFLKKELLKIGIDERKILVSSDAVDLDKFLLNINQKEARKKVGLPLDSTIALYSDSFGLYPWKGTDIVLNAAKSYDKITFVLVGGSKEEIEKLGCQYNYKNIILKERQTRDMVPYYLKSADVLLLPNKKGDIVSELFTSPLKLFEYMASGVPIVVSDLPYAREVLNEENAVFFEPNNSESLLLAIKKLLEDKDLATKISERSLIEIKNYSWKARAEKILNFISQ